MQLNKFFGNRLSLKDKFLYVILMVLWSILVYIWMISDQNAKEIDVIYRLISTIQSPIFEFKFGLPYIIISAVIVFKTPTIPELQRLQNNKLLNLFIIKYSAIPTIIVLFGSLISILILFFVQGKVIVDFNNLFVGVLMLSLYTLGVYIICLVLNLFILMSSKVIAVICMGILVTLDTMLTSVLGFDLFLSRGITWIVGVYDYQIIVDFVLYSLYVFLLINNTGNIFRKRLFR